MIRKVLGAILLIFITTLTIAQISPQAKSQWVDSVYQALTFEQRIGQLFMVAAYSSGNEQHHEAIENMIRKNTIGGIVFLDGSPTKQANLTNRFQKTSIVPLLIGFDGTRGLGLQLDSTLTIPNALTMGSIQDDKLVYEISDKVSKQMKTLGIHLSIGPSAQLSSNSYFTQTYGSDIDLVNTKTVAFLKGMQDNNLISAAKYFPGYSDDNESKRNKKDLKQSELLPFKTLIDQGLSAVILDNTTSPLDPKKIPSTLSDNTIKILRESLGFNGLILSSALDNGGLTKSYKPGKLEAMAFWAGNDILYRSSNVNTSIRQIKKQINKGIIERTRLEQSVKRILSAKYDAGLSSPHIIDTDNIILKLNHPEVTVLNDEIFEKSITVIQNDSLLPIKILDENSFASLSIGQGVEFENYLDKYNVFTHYTLSNDLTRLENTLDRYDYLVIGVFDENIDLTTLNLINRLSRKNKVILCSFINPYKLEYLLDAKAVVISYSNQLENQRLVPQIIFGALEAEGRLPIQISEHYKFGSGVNTQKLDRLSFGIAEEVGMDSKILNKINDIAFEAIEEKATPGCQIIIARKGKIIFHKAYGCLTYDCGSQVEDNTVYDIASITKVGATTQALMFLEERKLIDLDKKISTYLPELKGTNKENMILRDILTHQAGLWPYIPFWQQTISDTTNQHRYYSSIPTDDFQNQISDGLYSSSIMKDSVWQWVKDSKLRDKRPNIPYDYKYSDMGYYMLQRLIERIVNQPVEEFLQQNFYDPMGLSTLCYLPLCRYPLNIIAPTEYDNYFRMTLVNGLVHDQGAAMLGGVAGHAGLFSNALDLAKLMQMNLQNGSYGGINYFMKGTVPRFTSKQYTSNRRGLGWDKPVPGEWNSPTSPFASKSSFGHTGFTGTAVWVDPEFDLVYIFLSNRIYPDAENKKLIKNNIRTRIQDLIYQSMWSYSATHITD
jgi:beta-N-acetylhexosaminidase